MTCADKVWTSPGDRAGQRATAVGRRVPTAWSMLKRPRSDGRQGQRRGADRAHDLPAVVGREDAVGCVYQQGRAEHVEDDEQARHGRREAHDEQRPPTSSITAATIAETVGGGIPSCANDAAVPPMP
jgi:hypothetical protein